jgi:hypothetical protein
VKAVEQDAKDAAAKPTREVEITSAMIEAGVVEIWAELGGADLGGHFSAPDLASRIYRAMNAARHL